MTIKGKLSRVIENPSIVLAKAKGVQNSYAVYGATIKQLYPEIKTIIDAGAGEGGFIKSMNFYYEDSKIYAFEPNQDLYEKNKMLDNVISYNFALWNESKIMEFNLNREFDGVSSFLKRTKLHEDTFNIPHTEEVTKVKAVRFDELDINIERPALLKIDVEGGELQVLKGFGNRLKEIDVVQIEYFFGKFYKGQAKLSKIIKYLEGFELCSFLQRAVEIKDGNIIYCDLIFFRKQELKTK